MVTMTATISDSTKTSTSTMSTPDSKTTRPSKSFGDDEQETKYGKRRKQQQKRLGQSLVLFAVSLCVLCYTWGKVRSNEDEYQIASQQDKEQIYGADRNKKFDNLGKKKKAVSQSFLSRLFQGDARMQEFEEMLEELDRSIIENVDNGIRWVNTDVLPSLNGDEKPLLRLNIQNLRQNKANPVFGRNPERFFKISRMRKDPFMAWEQEALEIGDKGPAVDFTRHSYEYPPKLSEPPENVGEYPKLIPMKEAMEIWPQDDIDNPPDVIQEALIHFDYNNPEDLKAARRFRDAKLPFKLRNVPEVVAAGKKWTDEYLTEGFSKRPVKRRPYPPASGNAQESSDNYFAFFQPGAWPVKVMGVPPSRNNDWTFEKWAAHARYADAVGLSPHKPHFYWQSGVDRDERYQGRDQWSFISRDLPSFSSTEENFFLFHPESQKGIQCRFGERGVTAATHFDAGRNMIAMISGAKRYILSPPKECNRLGIVTERGNAIFRHSMLNFGHINHINNPDMPEEERQWLERAGQAGVVDTVLRAGEVLYLPSHWFHYITSLQKSAQCNVRSGVDVEGDDVFGGKEHVTVGCEV